MMNMAGHCALPVVEASIDQLSAALASGQTSSVELVAMYLNRIAAYDRRGPCLNSTPVLNPACFEEASACDRARHKWQHQDMDKDNDNDPLPPLHGIPFTVKDSYKVAGLTVAAGSPAFASLVAQDDSFAVAALRRQGAIVLGKTNMPPMAVGGCQRGVYGRSESPYNPDYLPAAWHSGSSSGSGVAVSASLCAFGLGEETVSSGRSPASNGGLVAYTPSRGLISIRGNWPLFPLRDTVVPHTRSVRDLLHVLNALVVEDDDAAAGKGGDLWKSQTFVELPSIASVRPAGFDMLQRLAVGGGLKGRRLGIPKMYIDREDSAAAVKDPIAVRPSILQLLDEARALLTRLGATCVDVDFPVVSTYEKDRPGMQSLVEQGMLPTGWNELEINDMVSASWEEFLQLNGDPACSSLAGVNPWVIHADPPEAVDTRRTAVAHDGQDQIRYDYIVDRVSRVHKNEKNKNESNPESIPEKPLDFTQLPKVCAGLERARAELFEQWLKDEGLDGVVFPANADVAPANADTDETSSAVAWRNGVVFSNTNHVLRHLGIPSVTVTMGQMLDTRMPVGLTFAGPAYCDKDLLAWAYDYETASTKRVPPESTPELSYLVTAAPVGDVLAMAAGVDMGITLSGHAQLDATGAAHVTVEAFISLPSQEGSPSKYREAELSVVIVADGRQHAPFKKQNPAVTETFQATMDIPASERRGARLQSSLMVAVATLVFKDEARVWNKATEGCYVEVPYRYL